jgi:hypothetical protein
MSRQLFVRISLRLQAAAKPVFSGEFLYPFFKIRRDFFIKFKGYVNFFLKTYKNIFVKKTLYGICGELFF